MPKKRDPWLLVSAALLSSVAACAGANHAGGTGQANPAAANELSCPESAVTISEARAIVDHYCVNCHSPSGAAGPDYDFRSDTALIAHRRNVEAKLRLGAMPPTGFKQPPAADRHALQCWARPTTSTKAGG